MRIVNLKAEAFKRLVAIDVTPNQGDPVVVVSGPNGAGKSSVLDAIWAALSVRGAKVVDPIRHGEHEASVAITLDNGVVVTRTWKGDKNNLTVTSAAGARFNSPQAMLDSMVGRLSFDPLAFAQASPKDQRKMLLAVVDLKGFDLDAADADHQRLYEERTENGREVKRLTALRDSLEPVPEGTPPSEVDVAEVAQRIVEARQVAGSLDDLQQEWAFLEAQQKTIAERLAAIGQEVPNLRQRQADLGDPAVLGAALASAQETNEVIRRGREIRKVASDLMDASRRGGEITRQMLDIVRDRNAALAAADLPPTGGHVLGITEDGVTLDGVPFAQASGAQRLKASVGIAMAANPDLRVLRVADGALLDDANMAVLREMAAERGYQIWLERVGDEPMGVRIEDGAVAG